MNNMYASNDMYGSGESGGEYPPVGGVGTDIIIETLAGVYDASNTQGFSGNGEWFCGTFTCPFDKITELISSIFDNINGPVHQFNFGLYKFNGTKISETGKFYNQGNGSNSAFLQSPVQLLKGIKYRFAIWGEGNCSLFYKNGLASITSGTTVYAYRSNGNASDLPVNVVNEGVQSPIYPYGVIF